MSVFKMLVTAAGTALVLAALTACGGSSGDNTGNPCSLTGGASSGTAAQTVQLVSDPSTVGAFQPKSISVKVGDVVGWDWVDQGVSHTVTAENGSFDSGLCPPGTKFFVTFSTAGTVNYHCTIHAQMTATLTVT
jgi:plastocyanin